MGRSSQQHWNRSDLLERFQEARENFKKVSQNLVFVLSQILEFQTLIKILLFMNPTSLQITELLELSVAFGILKRTKTGQYTSIRLAYHPYRSSQQLYDLVRLMSQVWRKLIFEASNDLDLMQRVFKNMSQEDPVVLHLLNIIKKKQSLDIAATKRKFNFVRSDFFIDANGVPKLIEYNLDTVSMSVHNENLQKVKKLSDLDNSHNYFESEPNQNLLNSIDHLYKSQNLTGIVLLVIDKVQSNPVQLRRIQSGLFQKKIKAKMITLEETAKLTLDGLNNLKFGEETVEFVYYRAGYSSNDYLSDWKNLKEAMEVIELSNAVKVPDATMKLVNSKRMQAELSKPEVHEKYLTKEEAEVLMLSVIRQWEFDSMTEEEIQRVLQEYEKNKENFVLKPNSEGGGNNLWGEEGYETLKRSRPNERSMFILMQQINTKPIENILFDCTKSLQTPCDYEISHYGIIQGKDRELTQNETVGHMKLACIDYVLCHLSVCDELPQYSQSQRSATLLDIRFYLARELTSKIAAMFLQFLTCQNNTRWR